MPETLGQYIAERRSALGLTQEELADRVGEGVRQSEISRLEHDRVVLPRRFRMEQIAQALDVPIGELLLNSGTFGIEHDGARRTYRAHGQPMATAGGGLLGVVTIQAASDHAAPLAR